MSLQGGEIELWEACIRQALKDAVAPSSHSVKRARLQRLQALRWLWSRDAEVVASRVGLDLDVLKNEIKKASKQLGLLAKKIGKERENE